MTRPALPAARLCRRVLAGALAAGLLAACAALTLAASPARAPARPAAAAGRVHHAGPAGRAPVIPAFPGRQPQPVPRACRGSSGTSCGFLDVSCEIGNAITSWFAALARDALGRC